MKNLVIALMALIFFSCSHDELIVGCDSDFQNVSKNVESIYKYIAQRHQVKSRNGKVYLCPIIQKGDTVAFLANYDDGWELFSNNTGLPMVLMKSDNGSFYPDVELNVSPFEQFYNDYIENLTIVPQNDDVVGLWCVYRGDAEIETVSSSGDWVGNALDKKEKSYTPKGGRLKTKWDQMGAYSMCTPFFKDYNQIHCPLGCGTVAVGQILYHSHKYFGLPSSTVTTAIYNAETNTYSFSGNDSSVWNLMDSGEDESFGYDVEKMMPTAIFLGYVAQHNKSKFGELYGNETVGDYWWDRMTLETQMNVTVKQALFNWSDVTATLSKGYPVFTYSYHMAGYTSEYGHSYIIDEANEIQEIWYDVFANGPKKDSGEIKDEELENGYPSLDDYIEMYENISFNVSLVLNERWMKMNWGWRGRYDDVLINADEKVWEVASYSFNEQNIFSIK